MINVNRRRCFSELEELHFSFDQSNARKSGLQSLSGKCCVDYTQIIITGKMLSNLLSLIAGVNTLHRYSAQPYQIIR